MHLGNKELERLLPAIPKTSIALLHLEANYLQTQGGRNALLEPCWLATVPCMIYI
jgi:hypothetical protein